MKHSHRPWIVCLGLLTAIGLSWWLKTAGGPSDPIPLRSSGSSPENEGERPQQFPVHLTTKEGAGPSPGKARQERSQVEGTERHDGEHEGQVHPAGRRFVLTGRCVSAEDGQPLTGCEVFLDVREAWDRKGKELSKSSPKREVSSRDTGEGKELDGWNERRWIRPIDLDRLFLDDSELERLRKPEGPYRRRPETRTGADGRFRLEYWSTEKQLHWQAIKIASPGRLPIDLSWYIFQAPFPRDLGTLAMHRGVRVKGHVRGQESRGLDEVWLEIQGLPHQYRSGGDRPVTTVSRKDGWFAFAEPIPEGRWRLTTSGPGVVPCSGWLHVGKGDLDTTLIVQERPSISGTLLLPSGLPATQLDLLAVAPDRQIQGRARTDSEGRFHIRPEHDELTPVRLATKDPDWELLSPTRSLNWGTHDLRWVVRSSPPLDLIVIDHGTGQPILNKVDISAFPVWDDKERKSYSHLVPLTTIQRILNLRSGLHRFLIEPPTDSGWASRRVDLDIPLSDRPTIYISLRRSRTWRVLVLDEQGRPYKRSNVEVAPAGSLDMQNMEWKDSAQPHSSAETEKNGQAILRGLPVNSLFDVIVEPADYPSCALRNIDPLRPLIVQLQRGGSLSGKVTINEEFEDEAFLELRNGDQRHTIYLDEDGQFEEREILPGLYRIFLSEEGKGWRSMGKIRIRPGGKHRYEDRR